MSEAAALYKIFKRGLFKQNKDPSSYQSRCTLASPKAHSSA